MNDRQEALLDVYKKRNGVAPSYNQDILRDVAFMRALAGQGCPCPDFSPQPPC